MMLMRPRRDLTMAEAARAPGGARVDHLLVAAMVALPLTASAQDATIGGTITDSTGGTLPGVAVTATNEASGNTFSAVTDQRGEYRIPVRVGAYRISAELSGFNTINRAGLELLVNRLALGFGGHWSRQRRGARMRRR